MGHPTNELAITVAVGQFIKTLREAEEQNKKVKPSMYKLLLKNGVKSANRARQLIHRMIDNKVIIRHRDGSFTLTKKNWDSQELMPILLRREYNKKSQPETETIVVIQKEVSNPFSCFMDADLKAELERRGWIIPRIYREKVIVEEL